MKLRSALQSGTPGSSATCSMSLMSFSRHGLAPALDLGAAVLAAVLSAVSVSAMRLFPGEEVGANSFDDSGSRLIIETSATAVSNSKAERMIPNEVRGVQRFDSAHDV